MSKKTGYLRALHGAILIQHGCVPVYKKTVFVHEKLGQKTVWKGRVEVFDLLGHKQAKTCYAWQTIKDGAGEKIFTVLGNTLIDSPQKAVQAAIFMDTQPIASPPPPLTPRSASFHQFYL